MYNRYIRQDDGSYTRVTDDGVYTRIPQEDRPPASSGAGPERSSPSGGQVPPPNTGDTPPPKQEQRPPEGGSRWSDGLTGMLRHFLDQLHLDHVDTGDLLLLVLLFFLFREDADEELLVALGLLLIL